METCVNISCANNKYPTSTGGGASAALRAVAPLLVPLLVVYLLVPLLVVLVPLLVVPQRI